MYRKDRLGLARVQELSCAAGKGIERGRDNDASSGARLGNSATGLAPILSRTALLLRNLAYLGCTNNALRALGLVDVQEITGGPHSRSLNENISIKILDSTGDASLAALGLQQADSHDNELKEI